MTKEDMDIFKSSQEILSQADRLYSHEEVGVAIDELAKQINNKLKNTNPVIIAVLNGGLIPCGLLLPKLNFPLQTDYLHATRYGKNTTGGELEWIAKPSIDIKGRTVLLVDDIHDEGNTLKSTIDFCESQGAKAVYSCVLIHKVHDRKNSKPADFSGLHVPDRYVFGYGMDYKTLLRNAPGIFAVKDM
ncbi:MAG: hypoxanthine-guanine phosphoribosyltransferase [Pseudomonadota bacterium]